MTERSVEELIKGMPHSQQGRARTLYERGKAEGRGEAVAEITRAVAQIGAAYGIALEADREGWLALAQKLDDMRIISREDGA
jgi:hypothetical protein